jgi:hypothetical protein
MNASSKTDDQITSPDEIDVIVLTDEPRSKLGQVVVTPAAIALLKEQNLQPGFLLGWHAMEEADAIDLLCQSAQKVESEDNHPITTKFDTQFGPVLVVTELVNDASQNRIRTRMLLPGEQP